MPSILVRDLDDKIVRRLKTIAKHHGRSLQREVKAILTETVTLLTMEEAALVAASWQGSFKGRQLSDSVGLIREDRDR